jgi:methyl-accepting chemotaxis protein
MPVTRGLMMFLWQSTNGINTLSGRDVHWLMIFVAIIALALVVQALGFVIAAVFASKLLLKLGDIAERAEERTGPFLTKTTELLDDVTPRLRSISNNVEQMSYTVRAKCDEVGETLSQLNRTVVDANNRTRNQVARVDGIVSDALHTTEQVSHVVQEGIRVPVKQMAGIIAGLKVGLETFVRRSPFGKSSK